MGINGTFRRRHLPHWDVDNKPIFIMACLDGSISSRGMKRIRDYRTELDSRPQPSQFDETQWEHVKNKMAFKLMDELLDFKSPVQHLRDAKQAQIVQDAFLHFSIERYCLLAFVVMPSHHHWLFQPKESWSIQAAVGEKRMGLNARTPREIISHSIQSYTASKCNIIRGDSGKYWQDETFDHWVRDEEEMIGIIRYIEANPVKAGLVTRPENWLWSSAKLRFDSNTPPGTPLSPKGFSNRQPP